MDREQTLVVQNKEVWLWTRLDSNEPHWNFRLLTLWRPLLPYGYPDVKNYKWRLNPIWHRMLYSCTRMAAVGVKELSTYSHYRDLLVIPNLHSIRFLAATLGLWCESRHDLLSGADHYKPSGGQFQCCAPVCRRTSVLACWWFCTGTLNASEQQITVGTSDYIRYWSVIFFVCVDWKTVSSVDYKNIETLRVCRLPIRCLESSLVLVRLYMHLHTYDADMMQHSIWCLLLAVHRSSWTMTHTFLRCNVSPTALSLVTVNPVLPFSSVYILVRVWLPLHTCCEVWWSILHGGVAWRGFWPFPYDAPLCKVSWSVFSLSCRQLNN